MKTIAFSISCAQMISPFQWLFESSPQQLELAYHLVPFIQLLLFLLYPIAKPGALLLDYLVHGPEGEDEMQEEYNRDELSALVNLQYEQRQNQTRIKKLGSQTNNKDKSLPVRLSSHWTAMKHEMLEAVSERYSEDMADEEELPPLASELTAPMEKQEVDVVVGALQMKTRVATDVFTPRSQVYSIPDDLVMDREGMIEIYAKGYSRVPVYCYEEGRDEEINKSCIIGFLMTRQLMLIDWDHEREVCTLPLVRPQCVSPRRNLVELLRLLRSGGSLMAFVCARPDLGNRALLAEQPLPVEAGFIGIITLEDILESILQERIYDERDIKERDRAMATLTKWAAEKLTSFIRRSVAKRRFSFGRESVSSADGQMSSPVSESTPLLQASAR
jgi:metal transporter CNNM